MWTDFVVALRWQIILNHFEHGFFGYILHLVAVAVAWRSAAKVSPAELTKILSERIANFKDIKWTRDLNLASRDRGSKKESKQNELHC